MSSVIYLPFLKAYIFIKAKALKEGRHHETFRYDTFSHL